MDVFAKIYSKFTETVKTRSLIEPGDVVIASLSGGSDSVALLWLLVTFAKKNAENATFCPVTVKAFHFNHMILFSYIFFRIRRKFYLSTNFFTKSRKI